jgi:hypothetical protein
MFGFRKKTPCATLDDVALAGTGVRPEALFVESRVRTDEHIDGLAAKLGVDRAVEEEERRADRAYIAALFVKHDAVAPPETAAGAAIDVLWAQLDIERRGRQVWVKGLPYKVWLARLNQTPNARLKQTPNATICLSSRSRGPSRRPARRAVRRRTVVSRDGPGRSTDDPPDLPLAGSRSLRRAA